jgi:hypothetical protein
MGEWVDNITMNLRIGISGGLTDLLRCMLLVTELWEKIAVTRHTRNRTFNKHVVLVL